MYDVYACNLNLISGLSLVTKCPPMACHFVGVPLNTRPISKPLITSLIIIVADAPASSKMQTMPGLPVPITLPITSVVL